MLSMKANLTLEAQIKTLLGNSYGWDSETQELQYRGNPVSFWMTDHEAAMLAKAKELAA